MALDGVVGDSAVASSAAAVSGGSELRESSAAGQEKGMSISEGSSENPELQADPEEAAGAEKQLDEKAVEQKEEAKEDRIAGQGVDGLKEESKAEDRKEGGREEGASTEQLKAEQEQQLKPSKSHEFMMARADLLDMSNLDESLERALSKRSKSTARKDEGEGDGAAAVQQQRDGLGSARMGGKEGGTEAKAEWEIDITKLLLKKRIARGTYGVVYRGIYNGNDVAVKMLDFGEAETVCRANLKEKREAFKKEAAVWCDLNHPNVIQFIGASVTDSEGGFIPSFSKDNRGNIRVGGHLCCLVVEFAHGGMLKDLLIQHRRKKLPFRTVLQLALDIARGLAYLHSKNIVHRDVKSENLLLDRRRRVKIADFGVARVQAANPMDMTGSTGTLGYMAPEVLNGSRYDFKADVYSFAICLWEIYCCDCPFPDLGLKEMAAVVNKGLRPTIPGICPPQLAAVMRQGWDGKPEKRPTMEQVVELLEAIDPRKGSGMAPVEELPSTNCLCM